MWNKSCKIAIYLNFFFSNLNCGPIQLYEYRDTSNCKLATTCDIHVFCQIFNLYKIVFLSQVKKMEHLSKFSCVTNFSYLLNKFDIILHLFPNHSLWFLFFLQLFCWKMKKIQLYLKTNFKNQIRASEMVLFLFFINIVLVSTTLKLISKKVLKHLFYIYKHSQIFF